MRPDWAGPGSRAFAAIEAQFIVRQINGSSQGHVVGSQAAPEDAQAEMALVPDTYEDLGGAQQVPILTPELAEGQAEGVPDSRPCMENIENSSLHSNCGLQTAESPPKPGSQPMQLSESPPKPRSQPMHHSERPPKPSSQHVKQHPDSVPAAGSPVTHPTPQDTPYGSPAGGGPCQAALDQDPAGPPAAQAVGADNSEDELFEDAAEAAQILLDMEAQPELAHASALAAASGGQNSPHAAEGLTHDDSSAEAAAAAAPAGTPYNEDMLVCLNLDLIPCMACMIYCSTSTTKQEVGQVYSWMLGSSLRTYHEGCELFRSASSVYLCLSQGSRPLRVLMCSEV